MPDIGWYYRYLPTYAPPEKEGEVLAEDKNKDIEVKIN
jgi:hypothetical protein